MEGLHAVVRDCWVLGRTSPPQNGEKLHQQISVKFQYNFSVPLQCRYLMKAILNSTLWFSRSTATPRSPHPPRVPPYPGHLPLSLVPSASRLDLPSLPHPSSREGSQNPTLPSLQYHGELHTTQRHLRKAPPLDRWACDGGIV